MLLPVLAPDTPSRVVIRHHGLHLRQLAAQLGARVDIVTVSEPWAVGMYDAMGWSAGYEASPEYKQDREAAAQKILPELDQDDREELRAVAAATDNIGRFFGEDVFIALGAVLLIQAFYTQHGIELSPLAIALWALPTAVAAFVIQSVRIWLYQRRLQRRAARRERGA